MKLFAFYVMVFVLTSCAASTPSLPSDMQLKGKISYTSDETGRNRIYVMNADGSDAAMLGVESSARDGVHSPSWSPDGRCFCYISGDYISGGLLYFSDADGSKTWQMTTVTGLIKEKTPSWSPNGECIAVAVGNLVTDLYTVCADGRVTQLTDDPDLSSNYNPVWSNDNQLIAFTSTISYAIHIIDLDEGKRVQVHAPEISWQSYPTWSPDNSQLVFVGRGEEHDDLYLVNVGPALNVGTTVEKLTDLQGRKGTLFSPTWSPDGDFIAFSFSKDGNSDIYVLRLDDKKIYQITHSGADEFDPVWYDPIDQTIDNSLCPMD